MEFFPPAGVLKSNQHANEGKVITSQNNLVAPQVKTN